MERIQPGIDDNPFIWHKAKSHAPETCKYLFVFYREKKGKGKAIRFQISDSSGVSVGALPSGSMFYQYYDPGQKTFTVRSPSVDGRDLITLDIVAGETYLVRGEILWGWNRQDYSSHP